MIIQVGSVSDRGERRGGVPGKPAAPWRGRVSCKLKGAPPPVLLEIIYQIIGGYRI